MSDKEIFGEGTQGRRSFLKKAAMVGAFAVPAVSTFAMMANASNKQKPQRRVQDGSNIPDNR
jgi:hypothetical protein